MSEPIKLKLAGEKHTLTVKRVRLLPFGNDPEIEYEGTDGSKVWVPQKSSDRQLARLNLTEETVCGRRITIRRDPNSAKGRPPFWGIYLEDGEGGGGNGTGGGATPHPAATTQPAAPPAPVAPAPQNGDKPHGYALYKQITMKVLDELPALYDAAGIPLTPDAAVAAVATIFIQAERR